MTKGEFFKESGIEMMTGNIDLSEEADEEFCEVVWRSVIMRLFWDIGAKMDEVE